MDTHCGANRSHFQSADGGSIACDVERRGSGGWGRVGKQAEKKSRELGEDAEEQIPFKSGGLGKVAHRSPHGTQGCKSAASAFSVIYLALIRLLLKRAVTC